MSESVYNLRIEQMSESEFNKILNEFKSFGWKYVGNWNLGNVHKFAKFIWDNDKKPIYPKGFETNTKSDPIDPNKFSRPV